MALWQYDFNIIPQGRNNSNKFADGIISWKGINVSPNVDVIFSDMLPLTDSWSKDLKLYGKDDSTCVELLFEDDAIEEITCRLDMRNLSKAMLINILDFIKVIRGEIYADGYIIKPELNIIVPIMKKSNAAKFCSDPTKYLEQLGTEL